jgi:hypothetical protein
MASQHINSSTSISLAMFVADFAHGIEAVDKCAEHPRWGCGIGSFDEIDVVDRVMAHLRESVPVRYATAQWDQRKTRLSYPDGKQKLDIQLGAPIEWAVEVKMGRLRLGKADDGKSALDDPAGFKEFFSPYPSDRSALTDCSKLINGGFGPTCNLAVIIYGFNDPGYRNQPPRPIQQTVDLFTELVEARFEVRAYHSTPFTGLRHYAHKDGAVYGWQIAKFQRDAINAHSPRLP